MNLQPTLDGSTAPSQPRTRIPVGRLYPAPGSNAFWVFLKHVFYRRRSGRVATAAIVIASVLAAPPVALAQRQPALCNADSTPAPRDTTEPAPESRHPPARRQPSMIPRYLVPLLHGSAHLAGSVTYPMVYESAYPKGPLIWRRSSRPVYTQRAGLVYTTGWLQTSPKSSRWIYVPVPQELPLRCPVGRGNHGLRGKPAFRAEAVAGVISHAVAVGLASRVLPSPVAPARGAPANSADGSDR